MCKKILAAVLILLMPVLVVAQSMSDDQVINYIMKEKGNGTPDKQIALKLLKQGVSTTQLQRIRRKYQSGQNSQVQQLQQPIQKDENVVAQPVAGAEELLLVDSLELEEEVPQTEDDVFGRNIFNNKLLTFQPSQNMATPQNYRLGAGDHVVIEVWGAAQQTFNKTISADGTVTITDHADRTVTVPVNPERVIILDILPLPSVLTIFLNSPDVIVAMQPASMAAAKAWAAAIVVAYVIP